MSADLGTIVASPTTTSAPGTPDPALLEVTGGLATVMDGWDAPALARAVPLARRSGAEELRAGVEHASTFTWQRTAKDVRAALSASMG